MLAYGGAYAVFAVFCGIGAGYIGKARGQSFWIWFAVGLVLPMLGNVAAALSRNENDEPRRLCPYCRTVCKTYQATCMKCAHDLPYPKDDEPRTLRISQDLLDTLATRIAALGLARDDLLFPSRDVAGGTPLSRATFNTRYWHPAVTEAGIDFPLRMHVLRHAHASWLLAGGADLVAVMERMGHSQIMTTQKYLHTLPDADDKVSLGMTATLTLADAATSRVARVPLSALFSQGGPSSLYVVDDKGDIALKPVTVKSYESNDVVISGGVEEGAKVVVLGVQKLDPSQKVRVVSALSF